MSSKLDQLVKLSRLGFTVVKHTVHVASTLTDDSLSQILVKARYSSQYELDGLVIDINSATIRQSLSDPNSLNPKYAVKFKVADASNLAQAKVVEVEWNLSKHGYFKPRVKIEPTELVGVTVQHASGFNAKFIQDNMIGKGAVVSITRSGDVIPHILSVITPAVKADLPDADYMWNETGVDILMTEADSNSDVQLQRLIDFFTTLNVPKFKEGNLKAFVELGISDPAIIIDLTMDDISGVVGSKIIGKEIFDGIRQSLTNVPLYVIMGALTTFGRGIGVRKMKKLWEAFHGDMTMCKHHDSIAAVEGFDEKTAAKIVNGYEEFVEFFDRIKHQVTLQLFVDAATGPLTGKTFVFTGFRDSSLEDQIINLGGKMGSGVSSKTTYLVSNDPDSTSGKAQKARDLGVQVIGINELKSMVQ